MTRLAVLTTHPIQYYAPLFRELAARLDLTVFYAHRATPADQAAAGFDTAFDWDIDLLSGYDHVFLRNIAADPNASRFSGCDTPEIGERLDGGRFDAVLALGWHVKSLLQGIVAAKLRRLPVLVRGDSQLGLQPSPAKRLAKRLAYPSLLRAFDAALAVGSRNRAFFRHYHYPEDRIFRSPHAVDNARFASFATAEARATLRAELRIGDVPVILFAGKLLPFKRPLDVVEAAARIRVPGARILVAGSGPLGQDMARRAAALGVPCDHLGFVNQSGMPAVYAAADVLVLPSSGRETWGLVANEALASGTPVVLSDEAGCAPDLSDGVAARTYSGGDVDRLAASLQDVLSAPPQLAVIKRRAEAFGLDRAVDGIIEALAVAAPRSAAKR